MREVNKIYLVYKSVDPQYTDEILFTEDCPIEIIDVLINIYKTQNINVDLSSFEEFFIYHKINLLDFLEDHGVKLEDIQTYWETLGYFIIDFLEYYDFYVLPEEYNEYTYYV